MTKRFFRRDAEAELARWSDDEDRKPLVIRGARQVGKTSMVRAFAAKHAGRFAELNLERSAHADIFRRGLSLKETVQRILLECSVPASPEPLVLFLDEIQAVPEAVALLRYFHEERPDIRVIAAGSLLEASMAAANISFPVGRVQFLYLRPMSFAEFLWAAGEIPLRDALEQVPVPVHAHDLLLNRFHQYALIGGMPEAVSRYMATDGDLAEVNQVYADLFTAFRDDIPKYGRNETMRRVLLHCLDSAPYEAGARVTFHGFGGSNYRSREVGEALRSLERAMLLELIHPTVACQEPLMPDRRKSPRLQFLDAGLVNHRAGLQRNLIGLRDLTDVHRGRLVEQIIGQELKATDARSDVPLRFWVRDKAQSQAELDYLLQTPTGVVPVEAKSGAAGKLRSLHQFMAQSEAPLGVRLYAGLPACHSVSFAGVNYRLVNVPYYAASMILHYIEWGKG